MERNPVGWFEIYVQDMDRARRFYEGVFQYSLEKLKGTEHEMWMFPGSPERPGATGALIKIEGVSSAGCSTLVYFSCEDCATEASRVQKNGGKIHKEKFSIGEYGNIALVYDTEGNMLGLHSIK